MKHFPVFYFFLHLCLEDFFPFHSLQMPLVSTGVCYAIRGHTLIFMSDVAVIDPRIGLHFKTSLYPLYFGDQAGSILGSVRFSVGFGLNDTWICLWFKFLPAFVKVEDKHVLSDIIKNFTMYAWISSQYFCVVFTMCALFIFLVYPFLCSYRCKLHFDGFFFWSSYWKEEFDI